MPSSRSASLLPPPDCAWLPDLERSMLTRPAVAGGAVAGGQWQGRGVLTMPAVAVVGDRKQWGDRGVTKPVVP